MNKVIGSLGILVVIAGIVAANALFTVNERQQALIIQLGEFKREITEPGLNYKIPFIQDVVIYEKRVLNVDPSGEEILLSDQKRLVVDAFIRYRIEDPLLFFQTVSNEVRAEERMSVFLRSALRSVLAKVPQPDILSAKRVGLMEQIRTIVNEESEKLGIEIVDVRIRAADLPAGVRSNVFRRMESERKQEAALIRAEGEEKALKIRASADRERTVLLAEAEREAQTLRGQGDKEAIEIYAQALGRDPQFYKFYRSLEAYRNSLADEDTTLVLTPDGDFFRFFRDYSPGP